MVKIINRINKYVIFLFKSVGYFCFIGLMFFLIFITFDFVFYVNQRVVSKIFGIVFFIILIYIIACVLNGFSVLGRTKNLFNFCSISELYFFNIYFGFFGFVCAHACISTFYSATLSYFPIFVWFFYIVLNVFVLVTNPVLRFVSFVSLLCLIGIFVSFFIGSFTLYPTQMGPILYDYFASLKGYYNGNNRFWLVQLISEFDSTRLFSKLWYFNTNYRSLTVNRSLLNHSGLNTIYFDIINFKIWYAFLFLFIVILTYFFLRVFFFKVILVSFNFFFGHNFIGRKVSIFYIVFKYVYCFFFLVAVCAIIPFVFKIFFIQIGPSVKIVQNFFDLLFEKFVVPVVGWLYSVYDMVVTGTLKGIDRGSGLRLNIWVQVWIQIFIFWFSPWVVQLITYIFDTTFLFDFDKALSYKRLTTWYTFFNKFLKRTEGTVPKEFLPWRLAKKSKYVFFEDERDYYVYWELLPDWAYYLNEDKQEFFESEYYLERAEYYRYHILRFFSSHLVFLREQESLWREELNFFYRVGDESFQNISAQFFANNFIYQPLIKLAGREDVRTILESESLEEGDEDEIEDPYLDPRFEDNFVGQNYYHNYRVVKYFDWINVSDKKFLAEISDNITFYSKFWYSDFLLSKFGKSFVTLKEYEYRKFLNNSYYLYFENRATKNYYIITNQVSSITKPIGSLVLTDDSCAYDFFPSKDELSGYFYEYVSLSISDFKFLDNLIYADKSNFSGTFRVPFISSFMSKFLSFFEDFVSEFLVDNLFFDFCNSYGFLGLINSGSSNFSATELESSLIKFQAVNQFIDFVSKQGFLDVIYNSFFSGIFFQEFFYFFYRSISYFNFDFRVYASNLIKSYFSVIYKSGLQAFSKNRFMLQNFFVSSTLVFQKPAYMLLDYSYLLLHPSGFPKDYMSVFYVSTPINPVLNLYITSKLQDSDSNFNTELLDQVYDDSSVPGIFSDLDQAFVVMNKSCPYYFEQLGSYFVFSKNYGTIFFREVFLNSFLSTVTSTTSTLSMVPRSLVFNDIFFYKNTFKKLKVDLLSKQLDTPYGINMLSYDTIPKFVGFDATDIAFCGSLQNFDSSYSDLGLSSSFEEYYNFLFFSDYRSFYVSNFAVSSFLDFPARSFNRFFASRIDQPLGIFWRKWYSGFGKYFFSPLFFSASLSNIFSMFRTEYDVRIFDVWLLNYSFLFSTFVDYRFTKFKIFFFQFDIVSFVPLFVKLNTFPVFNRKFRFCNFFFFYSFFSTRFLAFNYFNWFFVVYWLVKFLGIVKFIIRYPFFVFRELFRVRGKKGFIRSLKVQFHFYKESETNFDFNDRVFFFLNEVNFLKSGCFFERSNFSTFLYSYSFFVNYFKK